MSILIKGMEMPKPGRYEAIIFVLDKSTAEIAISPAEDDIGYWKEHPLVPVPPHGRLIDADALAGDLNYDVELDQRALDEMDFVGKERERVQLDKDCKQNCLRYLSDAPTVIPADPAKEGEIKNDTNK